MSSVLGNLQDKLQKLQKTLEPIRKATKDVALAENNINKTIDELSEVLDYHKLTTQNIEEIKGKKLKASSAALNINNNNNNKSNDDEEWDDPFLDWIEKINEAKDYFANNKFKSSNAAIKALREIAKIALDKMDKYFRDLLKQHTKRNERVNY